MKQKNNAQPVKGIKKIPVITYLCHLLAVSMIFTGVTFARYSTATSGGVSMGVATFAASYTIDDISSTVFSNLNYWVEAGDAQGAIGVQRTIRFDLHNFEAGEDGTPARGSDVDLDARLRMRLPQEFADKLVLQLTGEGVVTPQIVLRDLIYEVEQYTDGEETYYVLPDPDAPVYASEERTLSSALFRDYEEVAGAQDTEFTVTGSLAGGQGTIVAQSSLMTVSITAVTQPSSYSVSYRRSDKDNVIYPQLYLDRTADITYYTIDIELDNEFCFPAANLPGGGTNYLSKQFVLYLSLSERVASEEFKDWDAEMDAIFSDTTGATGVADGVTGYHFDLDVPAYDSLSAAMSGSSPVGEERIRLNKNLEDGAVSFFHVLTGSGTQLTYVLPIEEVYDANGQLLSVIPTSIEELRSCCAKVNVETAEGQAERYISFAGISADARCLSEGADETIEISQSLSKSYSLKLSAVFTQASEAPASQGGGV